MNSLESSILRVWRGDAVLGAAFLAAEQTVVTCAHVLSGDGEEATAAAVEFDFPLVAPDKKYSAKILFFDAEKDIAVLSLAGTPPKGASPARMVLADDLWEHSFRGFGFPIRHRGGVWASGVLRSTTTEGWLQIEELRDTGFSIQPGFSGSCEPTEVMREDSRYG
jgi:hypothetical protein